MTLETIDLSPRIGTEMRAAAAELLSGAHTEQIRERLEQTGLILFRQVNLDDREQVAFARTLGDLVDQGMDNIYKVTLDKRVTKTADYLLGTFLWHIDGTTDEIPSRASLLSARCLSESGGQTEWANTYAAYEDLPQEEKDAIEGLQGRALSGNDRTRRQAQLHRGRCRRLADAPGPIPSAGVDPRLWSQVAGPRLHRIARRGNGPRGEPGPAGSPASVGDAAPVRLPAMSGRSET